MAMDITFLGTGTSQGIPMIGCDCEVCRSDDPRDKRLRTSAIITLDGRNLLIDVTPEFRLQCLAHHIRRVDAVLITHTHADHIFGMDDLRRFNQLQQQPLEVFAVPEHLASLEKVFGYARADRPDSNPDLPQLIFQPITGPWELFGHRIIPLRLPHGRTTSIGYRIGPLAYCTDLTGMPTDVLAQLQGLDTLVLGALRPEPHIAHLSLDQAIALAQQLQPRQTWLIHMGHLVSHHQVESQMPAGIRLAYDGLKISLP